MKIRELTKTNLIFGEEDVLERKDEMKGARGSKGSCKPRRSKRACSGRSRSDPQDQESLSDTRTIATLRGHAQSSRGIQGSAKHKGSRFNSSSKRRDWSSPFVYSTNLLHYQGVSIDSVLENYSF